MVFTKAQAEKKLKEYDAVLFNAICNQIDKELEQNYTGQPVQINIPEVLKNHFLFEEIERRYKAAGWTVLIAERGRSWNDPGKDPRILQFS